MTKAARQRQAGFGFAGYIALAIVAMGMLYGLYALVDANWVTSAGVKKGEADLRLVYVARDAKALTEALAARDQALKEKAAAEKQSAEAVAAASTTYQKGLEDGKKTLAVAIARVHAGYGLRDPGRPAGAAVCPPGGGPAPGAAAAGRDGGSGTELSQPAAGVLSDRASEFLIRLAGEADDVARQLGACQVIVTADRKASP